MKHPRGHGPSSIARALFCGVCTLWLASFLGLVQWAFPEAAARAQVPPDPPPPLVPLSSVEVPRPGNLGTFVKNPAAAIALGKALFWDMQIGSDGIQACASCHFASGADPRSINQLNPGILGGRTTFDGAGPNYHLTAVDFPFRKLADPDDRNSAVLSDTKNVASSQGVFRFDFRSVEPGNPVDQGVQQPDPIFNVGGTNVRRVEPRNTPSVINAVFNFRNFWDGRAQNEFNGVNPFGARDPNARVGRVRPTRTGSKGSFVRLTADCTFRDGVPQASGPLCLTNSSLASQAVGPPGNFFEMSFLGRTFPDIGRKSLPFRDFGQKVLALRPLGRQLVSRSDSVLGPYALEDGTQPGLDRSYASFIRAAFRPPWWKSPLIVEVDPDTGPAFKPFPNRPLEPNEYTLMEYNFSLFFGLAVQMYESTLIADQTPVDRFLQGNSGALTIQEQRGLDVFQDKGRCINCHGGGELTNASVANVRNQPLETMEMADLAVATYDNGFYNIGVRATGEDVAVGGTDPTGKPLSMTRLTGTPGRVAVDGSFKTPSLRNIALTAPYFHNGGQLTLRQVVDFYNRGADFHESNIDNLDPDIRNLGLTIGERDALVAFLRALTDERVRLQEAPFDHPQLFVPNGHPVNHLVVVDDGTGKAQDSFLEIPAVGAAGGEPLPTFLGTFPEVEPAPVDLQAVPFLTPDAVDFGAQAVGTTSTPLTVTVTNIGAGTLRVNSVAVQGTNARDFTLAGGTCLGTSVPSDGACVINLRFRPSAAGARSAQLTVTTNAVDSVRTVPLSGTGA